MNIVKKVSVSLSVLLSSPSVLGMSAECAGTINGAVGPIHNANTAAKAFMKLIEIKDKDAQAVVKAYFVDQFASYNKRESLSAPLLEEGKGKGGWPSTLQILRTRDKKGAISLWLKICAQYNQKVDWGGGALVGVLIVDLTLIICGISGIGINL